MLLKRIQSRILNYYTYCAYHSGVLPEPERLSRYREYRPETANFDHYDFRPTPGDEAFVHAVWVVDLITPAKLHASMRKIQRINWRDSIIANDKPHSWMESTRRINSGSWRNLGFVSREKRGGFLNTTLSDLPKSFKYAHFQALSITPSLSALVGCFYFIDQMKSSYSEIAKMHFLTEAVPNLNGSISIFDPRSIKEKRIERIRQRWRNDISKFMSKRFGTFFSSDDPANLPMVDLIEFSKNPAGKMHEFLIRHADEWKTDKSILKWASFSGDHKPTRHSTAYFFTDELNKEDLKIYGGADASALLARYSHSIPSNWTLEAIHSLLTHYEKLLSAARDKNFKPITSFRSRRDFLKAEKAVEIADIQLVADELRDEKFRWLTSNMVKFERESFNNEKLLLSKILPENIRRRAKYVSNHRTNIMAARKSINDSYSTFQMSKLTRFSLYTAVFSSIVSLFALFVAVLSVPEIQKMVLALF